MGTITDKHFDEVLERAESNLIKHLETIKYELTKKNLQTSSLLVDKAKEYSDASEKRLRTFVSKFICSKWYNRWFYLLRCKQQTNKFMRCFGRLCYLERDIEKFKKYIEEYEKKYPNDCEQENK